jgi:hypothetical protein
MELDNAGGAAGFHISGNLAAAPRDCAHERLTAEGVRTRLTTLTVRGRVVPAPQQVGFAGAKVGIVTAGSPSDAAA